jgi:hypothetical protein
MNRTKRVLAVGLLCFGASSLSFGEVFAPLNNPGDWASTYNSSTALFDVVIQQGGASLSGFPAGGPADGTSPFTNGTDELFSLTYTSDSNSGLLTLLIGPAGSPLDSLSFTSPLLAPAGGGLDHIGIALNAGPGETITLANLVLNGPAPSDTLQSHGEALDFAMAPPAALSAFTLTGDITMTWADGDNTPQLSAEIVGADSFGPPTPEPGTWALFGSALVGLGLLRRKRIV